MWKEKLGGYLIDVSKYVLTGVVIASLFKDMGDNRYLIYGIGILVAGFTLLSGLLLRSCFEFLQKVFLGLMYPFSCVLWAIFWSFPLLFFVR